ncbi:response regulator [Paenibacillus sp. KQZ6P-2]|uniref:Response regulator n=2 Tax=Paenibacillus mangrovi TaxID=2931978 RepID=A0A9X2B8L9_9BACL|nr:response regulator [Paenibacillus mangrovi]MCJ8014628.1 response regulator [Paenibacillus mangrovi]
MEPKLLLVEDEPGMLEEMQTYLQREGFRVLTACAGKEALMIARFEHPDLVVLDWMLPEVLFIQFLQQVDIRSTAQI